MNSTIEHSIKTLTEVADQLIIGLGKIATIDTVNGPSLAASTARDYSKALGDLSDRLQGKSATAGKPGTAAPGKAITRDDMAGMSPAALSAHFRSGGKVID